MSKNSSDELDFMLSNELNLNFINPMKSNDNIRKTIYANDNRHKS